MFLPIWEQVAAGSYISLPAVLTGHSRMAVKNEEYPVIIPSESESCHGILYQKVNEKDLALIDRFEGAEYKRTTVLVTLVDSGSDSPVTLNAETYCLNPDYSSIVSSTFWDEESFKTGGIEKFIQKYQL